MKRFWKIVIFSSFIAGIGLNLIPTERGYIDSASSYVGFPFHVCSSYSDMYLQTTKTGCTPSNVVIGYLLNSVSVLLTILLVTGTIVFIKKAFRNEIPRIHYLLILVSCLIGASISIIPHSIVNVPREIYSPPGGMVSQIVYGLPFEVCYKSGLTVPTGIDAWLSAPRRVLTMCNLGSIFPILMNSVAVAIPVWGLYFIYSFIRKQWK